MGVATAAAVIAGVGAAVVAAGNIASAVGAAGRKDPTFDMGGQSGFGAAGARGAEEGMGFMSSALRNEVQQGLGAQADLGSMLKQYAEGGALPTEADTMRSRGFAESQFAPQRLAMQQAFSSQLTQANRQAALSGRGINDPILRARLAAEQTKQQGMLEAQQGAFATQFAMQQPFQRLQFMGQRADVLTQRGQVALQSGQQVAATGLAAQQQDWSQRFSLAQAKYMEQANTRSEGEKWGGVVSSIGGGIGAIGSVMGGFNTGEFGKVSNQMTPATVEAPPAPAPVLTVSTQRSRPFFPTYDGNEPRRNGASGRF